MNFHAITLEIVQEDFGLCGENILHMPVKLYVQAGIMHAGNDPFFRH